MSYPASVSSLKSGGVSLVFHVPYDLSDEAFKVHPMQNKAVTLDIYLMEEE